ncbi:MAG TPA: hypothetical protein VFV37_05185 [Luteibaculaceae bacterium]|nr:hypothetical protein [Luteibaculaceae bacterium]
MTLTGYISNEPGQGGFLFAESGASFFKATVVNSEHSDMGLIYHHLSQGKSIELHQYVKDGKVRVGVFFKGFKIGSLSELVASVLLANIARGKKISAFVKRIDKKKFLPPSEIEIEVVVQ